MSMIRNFVNTDLLHYNSVLYAHQQKQHSSYTTIQYIGYSQWQQVYRLDKRNRMYVMHLCIDVHAQKAYGGQFVSVSS